MKISTLSLIAFSMLSTSLYASNTPLSIEMKAVKPLNVYVLSEEGQDIAFNIDLPEMLSMCKQTKLRKDVLDMMTYRLSAQLTEIPEDQAYSSSLSYIFGASLATRAWYVRITRGSMNVSESDCKIVTDRAEKFLLESLVYSQDISVEVAD